MSVHAATAQMRQRGQRQTLQTTVMPAPIGGIDGQLALASNDPSLCVYAFNLVPTEYGMRTREGYREWQIGVETAPGLGLGVTTIVPYHGVEADRSGDKLFCTTNEGIWDVTIPGAAPILKATFADQSSNAGYGVYAHYTTDAGETILFLADSANGLYLYDPALDTWALATGITGPVIADIVFVVVHKARIWFVEKDTTTAWYLPVGSKSGSATEFFYGALFRHGGDLVGLYSWTLDGGNGVDDILVAISRGGDVLPWQGADPSSAATWSNIGVFYVGGLPRGRRMASEFGGDMQLISSFGLTSMNDLLRGRQATPDQRNISRKISRFLRDDVNRYIDKPGWAISIVPDEAVMLIETPLRDNGEYIQFRVNLNVDAWAFWRDVPMISSDAWEGGTMFGTADNRVCRMDVPVDNVTLADPGGSGVPIQFSLLQNYSTLGAPGIFKWGEFIRPNFLSVQPVTADVRFLYDYATNELLQPDTPSEGVLGAWDAALWDTDVWGSTLATPKFKLSGTWGAGRALAIAMRGSSNTRATLVSNDIGWRAGGFF